MLNQQDSLCLCSGVDRGGSHQRDSDEPKKEVDVEGDVLLEGSVVFFTISARRGMLVVSWSRP